MISKSQPYLLDTDRTAALAEYAAANGAAQFTVNLTEAQSSVEIIERLKAVLPFPDWCGSGWDSIEDAFEELRTAWDFPLVLLVRGADELMALRPQLALETIVRLADLSHAFSVAGDQLIVAYPWRVPKV